MLGSPSRTAPRALALLVLVLGLSACVVVPPARHDPSPRRTAPDVSAGWVEYGPGLRADLYLPRVGGQRGTVVLVHGGAFVTGSRGDIPLYTEAIMRQLDRGFAVLSIDYRLTSGTTNLFPAAVADVSAAVDWVRREGAAYGAPTGTVVVAGHSAGATLAALIGVGANNPGPVRGWTSPVDGWIGISGTYDLHGQGIEALQRAVWLGPGAPPEVVGAASAIDQVDAQDPPAYLVHGERDSLVPVSQTQLMTLALTSAGANPWMDVVVDPACDEHVPTCAINRDYLDSWIDGVAARTL